MASALTLCGLILACSDINGLLSSSSNVPLTVNPFTVQCDLGGLLGTAELVFDGNITPISSPVAVECVDGVWTHLDSPIDSITCECFEIPGFSSCDTLLWKHDWKVAGNQV